MASVSPPMIPLGLKSGKVRLDSLPARMQRNQMAYILARRYEGLLSRMELAMDRQSYDEVQQLRGELMGCLRSIQDAQCQVHVDELLQRGRYHFDARRDMQERYEKKFSLLGLRGGGGAFSSCMAPERPGSGPQDDPYATRMPSQQPPMVPPSQPSGPGFMAGGPYGAPPGGDPGMQFATESAGLYAGGGHSMSVADRMTRTRQVIKEAESESSGEWGPLPPGPKGWLLAVKRFLDLPEVGATLIVSNTVSFTIAPVLDIYSALGGKQFYQQWCQLVMMGTITLMVIGLLLDLAFSKDGGCTHLSNPVILGDFFFCMAAFFFQVIVPMLLSKTMLFLLNLPLLIWRIFRFVRRVQEVASWNRGAIKSSAESMGFAPETVERGFHYGGVHAAAQR
mmetsp:Transcript_35646/g.81710  ORF Transcript_35646/g.81710 Transcript_35646/m.81710 type:complete len:394 (-) Transcript_35646:57-1238(-)